MAAFPVHRREHRPAVLRRAAPGAVRTLAPDLPLPRPPRLRVTVTRLAADGSHAGRFVLDTDDLPPQDGHQLHELVNAVESSGPPAGGPGASFGLVLRPTGAAPHDEVTVARGFGHWTVTIEAGVRRTALAALIAHVRGVPDLP